MSISQVIKSGVSALNKAASSQIGMTSFTGGVSTNQSNFLDLLVSEIVHQNPMEPMDNSQMVSQLSQFETVQKLDQLNENIGTMMVYQGITGSMNLLGKNVVVNDSSTGALVQGTVTAIRVENGFPGIVVNNRFFNVADVAGVQ